MPSSVPELRTCSNCKYYFAVTSTRGDCRRSPPVVLLSSDNEPLTRWPDMPATAWCGSHHNGVKTGEVKIGRPATRRESLNADGERIRELLPDATSPGKAFTPRHAHDLARQDGWIVAISRVSDVMRHLEMDGRAMSVRLMGVPTVFYFKDPPPEKSDGSAVEEAEPDVRERPLTEGGQA